MAHPTQTLTAYLRAGGVSVLLASYDAEPPRVLHWGADLGELRAQDIDAMAGAWSLDGEPDVFNLVRPATLLPQLADGWLGTPGLECDRAGTAWAPRLRVDTWQVAQGRLEVGLSDAATGLGATLEVELEAAGLARQRLTVSNDGEQLEVRGATLRWPVPARATEVLDLAGSWANERHPQRRQWGVGRWSRAARAGKPGCDGSLLMAAGVPGFGFEAGEVWGVHLGWSGNQELAAERTYPGARFLEGGEILYPGEVVLGKGETYQSPWLYGSWGRGLNQMSHRFHAHLRARHAEYRPVPVLANTWEATYFDQSMEKYSELAHAAAAVGVELFVVDDGWFGVRDDDTTSLGDWFVDPRKWPEGLRPLSDLVHSLGMQFGLWVEPEMISLQSDLAAAHPDWVFDAGHGPGMPARHQHVLDLTNPEAYAWIAARLHALVDDNAVDYFKWDHNRPLLDAGRQAAAGRPGVRGQVLATYNLMRELKEAHPGLRIESCSGGGGRIDLGVLDICDRVWTSDNNDPFDRLRIQQWTALVVPPEYLGCHIGAERAHTTGRVTDMSLRTAVALWGNLGLELDVSQVTDAERADIAAAIALHKQWREVLHTGAWVSADRPCGSYAGGTPDGTLDGTVQWGVVSPDGTQALYLIAMTHNGTCPVPDAVRLPGLAPEALYNVAHASSTAEASITPGTASDTDGGWKGGVCFSGAALTRVGLLAPHLWPGRCELLAARTTGV